MKRHRLFFALGLLLVLASSCHPDREDQANHWLLGEWELVEVTGGIHGQGYTPAFDLLNFSENRYELFSGEEVIAQGTYTFDPAVEHGLVFQPEGSTPSPAVGFEEQNKNVLFEGEDVLILSDPCCDLFVYRFERKASEGDD